MPRDRRRFFNIATASAKESASVLDIAYSFNLISGEIYNDMQDKLLQVVKTDLLTLFIFIPI
jgi:four helix bundle protein